MTMYPCRDCRLSESCDIREEKRRQIRGIGLTSIKFKCQKRTDSLAPGMKVKAHLPYVVTRWSQGSSEEESLPIREERTLDAFVMKWVKGKVRIYVPPEQDAGTLLALNDPQTELDVIAVNARFLEVTGERVGACIHCGLPENVSALRWTCRMEPSSPNDYLTGYSPQPLECEFPDESPDAILPSGETK